jgi:RNA polymerase sigma-B factor
VQAVQIDDSSERDALTRQLIHTKRTAERPEDREAALEELVRNHLPLARALAGRYAGRGIERDDLEQVALLALCKAIHRFDLSKDTEFGAYATPTITGELRRYFRDHGWLVRPPRDIQERRQVVAIATAELAQDIGREPTAEEVAEDLEMTPEQVREAWTASANLRPWSLDTTAPDGSRPLMELADNQEEPREDAVIVQAVVAQLPPREQMLVRLRFEEDLTQAEIAETMRLSPMQVSRLLKRTLATLREHLDEATLDASAGDSMQAEEPAMPA